MFTKRFCFKILIIKYLQPYFLVQKSDIDKLA